MDRRMLGKWRLKLCSFLVSVAVLTLTTRENVTAVEVEEAAPKTTAPHPETTGGSGACNGKPSDQHRLLMLVSTLDGKVTALNMADGQPIWSIDTGSRPLLSSSISKLEINRNGVPTKLIPSLDGGLYQFDGDGLEPVPLAADMMLSSTFRFNDNSMVVGGKEKETYGLNLSTGKVIYVCSASGCEYFDSSKKGEKVRKGDQDHTNASAEEVLVITRHTKTVRAVEMKTGGEKWNFSVGTHEISYIRSTAQPEDKRHIGHETESEKTDIPHDDCSIEEEDEGYDFSWLYENLGIHHNEDIDFKVIVPKGLVIAYSKYNPVEVLWKHKFDTAIASAWALSDDDLSEVSLFDDRYIPALSADHEPHEDDSITMDAPHPLIYIGLHENQLYVQPSVQMTQSVRDATLEAMHSGNLMTAAMPYITWRPYLATAASRTPIIMSQKPPPQLTWEHEQDPGDRTELSMWHKNYPYDEGYYIFDEKHKQAKPIKQNETSGFMDEIFIEDISVTLWNWWREVLAIAVVTAAVTHYCTVCCVSYLKYRHGRRVTDGVPTEQSNSEISKREQCIDEVEDATEATVEYVSRYCTDFEQETCLGKGGFGVVFQAKNILDDCEYAIKRIALNNSDSSREKVMREVKALAKLDHAGIVRYYQAWFENPPSGWQEERDKANHDLSATTTPGFSVTEYTPTNYPSRETDGSSSRRMHLGGGDQFNPLRPFDSIEEAGASREDTDSLRKVGSSEGFVPHCDESFNDFDEESDSFGLTANSQSDKGWSKEESFDIVFQNSDTSDNASEEESLSECKPVPFKSYKGSKESGRPPVDRTNDSLDIVFEDSGCAERSRSGEASGPHDSRYAIIDCSANLNESSSHARSSQSLVAEPPRSGVGPAVRPDSLGLTKKTTTRQDSNSSPKQAKLYLYIQMQLCQRQSLREWLVNRTDDRRRDELLDIYVQTVRAVEYVHDTGLMHRDLKPSNIFFSMDGQVKIGDFGLVTALEENCEYTPVCDGPAGYSKHTDQVGTKLYMSPEQGDGRVYTQKVDIYALGVIFVELFCPFSTQMERVRTLLGVRKLLFPTKFTKEYPEESVFVKPLLSPKPEERPGASAILECPLFAEFQNTGYYPNSGLRYRTTSRTRTASTSSSCGSVSTQQQ